MLVSMYDVVIDGVTSSGFMYGVAPWNEILEDRSKRHLGTCLRLLVDPRSSPRAVLVRKLCVAFLRRLHFFWSESMMRSFDEE